MAKNELHKWHIVGVDPEVVISLNGYTDNVDDDRPATLGGSGSLGAESPVVQWVSGGARRIRFRSRYVADDSETNIDPKVAQLRRLRERDPQLLRAPRVRFHAPGVLPLVGYASVSLQVVGLWPNGWTREVAFEVEIVESRSVTVQTVEVAAGETLWADLRSGETFESLAARLWRDPLRGDLIRRANPAIATAEAPGDLVKVLEREHPRSSGPVRPAAAPFATLRDGSTPWVTALEALGQARLSTPGLAWERLPEVVAGEV